MKVLVERCVWCVFQDQRDFGAILMGNHPGRRVPEVFIDDCARMRAHWRRAACVMGGLSGVAKQAFEICQAPKGPAIGARWKRHVPGDGINAPHGLCAKQFLEEYFHPLCSRLDIVGMLEEVRVDVWVVGRVCRPQPDFSS